MKRRTKSAKPADAGKVGLKHVAVRAGVSISSASRVLSGSRRVDDRTRDAVLEAANALGFDLSKSQKEKSLAFLLCNRTMHDAFHTRILMGAEAACAEHGWEMIFLSFNYSPHVPWKELHLPRVVQRHDVVRAVLLAGTNSANLMELLVHKNVNFVTLGNNVLGTPPQLKPDMVYSDDVQGGYDITRYLINSGHERIWYVGNIRLPWYARCYEGYEQAMKEAQLKPQISSIDSQDNAEIGYLGTKSILANGNATAIFCGSDFASHGVYRALRDSGLRIPEDISVAGCNDTVGNWLYPGLTTIREFPEQIGKKMVEAVLNRIAHPNTLPQKIVIPTEFVRRDSCRELRSGS
ncbi:LacI family DNA-binding transcriptional regulator [Edaphobacter albus]|uniref:LacI family DNA-binding transcriptional regulator n=1 Tax=Edaphobacter sp. 4G125 TaxID=2763071 RepID=UPI0016495BB6|nr:LacI family DNA-binding transcriptional regulator [Edaphobacter sp. 4G125]QNI35743.1 LacI family DNA-binding transcriptional regulator [Edaphobacter sp. 4G125]